MLDRNICKSAAVFCGLAFIFWADARSEDWMQKSVEVAGGGNFEFEFPTSWGKKPALDVVDGITTVRFGPYGPRKKPFFLVHIETVTTVEPVTSEATTKMTELEVENHKKMAAETDIPISDVKGPGITGHYFSITDHTPKIGEFDYLTLAILGSGHLLLPRCLVAALRTIHKLREN